MKFYERSLQAFFPRPSRLRCSLARSRDTRFTRPNRRACSQASPKSNIQIEVNLEEERGFWPELVVCLLQPQSCMESTTALRETDPSGPLSPCVTWRCWQITLPTPHLVVTLLSLSLSIALRFPPLTNEPRPKVEPGGWTIYAFEVYSKSFWDC